MITQKSIRFLPSTIKTLQLPDCRIIIRHTERDRQRALYPHENIRGRLRVFVSAKRMKEKEFADTAPGIRHCVPCRGRSGGLSATQNVLSGHGMSRQVRGRRGHDRYPERGSDDAGNYALDAAIVQRQEGGQDGRGERCGNISKPEIAEHSEESAKQRAWSSKTILFAGNADVVSAANRQFGNRQTIRQFGKISILGRIRQSGNCRLKEIQEICRIPVNRSGTICRPPREGPYRADRQCRTVGILPREPDRGTG